MKYLAVTVLIGLACLAVSPNHSVVGDEPYACADENLVRLQVERENLVKLCGLNHPAVVTLDNQIAIAVKELARAGISQDLVAIQVEREMTAKSYGDGHPRVKQLDEKISLIEKYQSKAAANKQAQQQLPSDLLGLVQKLTERVDALEREVEALKAEFAKAKIDDND